jgi:ABC-type phosphate transport system permease subunit
MSLKAFHIVFVAASILLAFGFGIWSLLSYKEENRTLDLVFGIGSLLAGVALVIYGRFVLRKLKNISYL